MRSSVLEEVRGDLQQKADTATRNKSQHFFRESVQFYGLKNAETNKIAREHFKFIKGKDKAAIFQLCEQLFASGYMEEALIACQWSAKLHRQFEEDDFKIFEQWMEHYIHNWATCDTFCNHTLGAFIKKYPRFIELLKRWTQSGNRWLRRGAAVSLIVPARKGEFLAESMEIANLLIGDEDDLVQKGFGWLLKVESQTHQKEIFDFVMRHKKHMPRTALRYAIEKMPEELRKKAMER